MQVTGAPCSRPNRNSMLPGRVMTLVPCCIRDPVLDDCSQPQLIEFGVTSKLCVEYNVMKDSFNSDFYVTAATVIPVLYLALTLQGPTFERVLKRWRDHTPDNSKSFTGSLRWTIHSGGMGLAATFAAIFIFSGIAAEFFALLGLYQRKASQGMGALIFISIVFLLFMVAVGPIINFTAVYVGSLYKIIRDDLKYQLRSGDADKSGDDDGGAAPPSS